VLTDDDAPVTCISDRTIFSSKKERTTVRTGTYFDFQHYQTMRVIYGNP